VGAAIFAYGTLEFVEVMDAVAGRCFPSRPARLAGYARRLITGRRYPGIIPAEGHTTEGTLYSEVDGASLQRLDAFEGSLYRRIEVQVSTQEGEPRSAWAWVVPDELRDLLSDEPWDKQRFAREELAGFVRSLATPATRRRGGSES
jgi:gamma-glutamylcyclotransferase (GGCT)/AIG2-like uncharacterized protein YtfP